MKSVMDLKQCLQSGALSEKLSWLYCCAAEDSSCYADRYLHVLEQLDAQYGSHEAAALFSAPGRTEIGGNHTDHQHGCVLTLKIKDYSTFLKLTNESGHSSWEYLQNITPAGAVKQQAVGLTIALAKELLHGEGAVRVHGGGFAGTVQAFVPMAQAAQFQADFEAVMGEGSCHVMAIRPVGGYRLV